MAENPLVSATVTAPSFGPVHGRRVPGADRGLNIVRALARDQDGDDLLFVTEAGHQLHASAVKRTVDWATPARGWRIRQPLPEPSLPKQAGKSH